MLTALKEIGKLLLEKENKQPLDILIENPDSNGSYKIVWVLEFDKDLNFTGITQEDFKGENYKIYLYKRGTGANSPDFSPTSRITEPEKTFTKKVIRWFENHKNILEFGKILDQLNSRKDQIINELNHLNSLSKDNKIITVKIDGKYLYEIDLFRKTFLEDFLNKIKEVSEENAVCSICGEKKNLVFTTSQIYKFYTLDKECYITSGFDKTQAWKNFPVCEECFLEVDYGKKFVENNLKFKFYSKNYYLIPKVLLNTPEVLEEISEILSYERKKINNLSKETHKFLTDDKEEILDLVKDYKDAVSFYFLFLKKDNAAERILLLVEDVLPSRIHKVFDTKAEVEKVFSQDYTFAKLNEFLGQHEKLFFEVIDKIFRNGRVSFSTLAQIFMRKIRDDFVNGKNFPKTTTDALMNVSFLEKLGLLKIEGAIMENSKFDEIYKKLGSALNSPAKRGIFLLGALTQMLLNIQGQERGNTPFFKNLKGLKMNEEDIKGLLPKVINKLMEYGRFDKGKKELASEISKNLLLEDKFKMSIDEINFYFASGMTLYDEVAKMIYEKEDNQND